LSYIKDRDGGEMIVGGMRKCQIKDGLKKRRDSLEDILAHRDNYRKKAKEGGKKSTIMRVKIAQLLTRLRNLPLNYFMFSVLQEKTFCFAREDFLLPFLASICICIAKLALFFHFELNQSLTLSLTEENRHYSKLLVSRVSLSFSFHFIFAIILIH